MSQACALSCSNATTHANRRHGRRDARDDRLNTQPRDVDSAAAAAVAVTAAAAAGVTAAAAAHIAVASVPTLWFGVDAQLRHRGR